MILNVFTHLVNPPVCSQSSIGCLPHADALLTLLKALTSHINHTADLPPSPPTLDPLLTLSFFQLLVYVITPTPQMPSLPYHLDWAISLSHWTANTLSRAIPVKGTLPTCITSLVPSFWHRKLFFLSLYSNTHTHPTHALLIPSYGSWTNFCNRGRKKLRAPSTSFFVLFCF